MSVTNQVRTSDSQPRGSVCITVPPSAELPALGGIVMLDTPVSGLVIRVTVRAILRLEWEYDQRRRDEIIGLRVWVRGEKEVVEVGTNDA